MTIGLILGGAPKIPCKIIGEGTGGGTREIGSLGGVVNRTAEALTGEATFAAISLLALIRDPPSCICLCNSFLNSLGLFVPCR